MRATEILLVLTVCGLSAPALADDDGKTGESGQAAKVEPQARKPAFSGVRMQQGRVPTDNDFNPSKTRKLPGQKKYGNIALKRGVISRETAAGLRSALAPLKRLPPMSGLSAEEAAYVRALNRWALAQDRRLQELLRLHAEYERLSARRNQAARIGGDTSHFDRQLAGLEDKLSQIGDDAQLANVDLQNTVQKQQQAMQQMSHMAKSMHDTAKAMIKKMSTCKDGKAC